jgi:hypothetical protein
MATSVLDAVERVKQVAGVELRKRFVPFFLWVPLVLGALGLMQSPPPLA